MTTHQSKGNAKQPFVLITGSSGLIGSELGKAVCGEYPVVGLDIEPPQEQVPEIGWIHCDMTDDDSVAAALDAARRKYGPRIASVIHLAAYYDFSGEPSPLYRELTVRGTRRLLQGLSQCEVEQFAISSTLLVMKPTDDDHALDADAELQAEWDYPRSKLAAEKVIREDRGEIPTVILRIAGVYDEDCRSLPIAQQVRRIYEKQLDSYFFPGDKSHGQAFVHLRDLIECFQQVIARRNELRPQEVFMIGEEDVMSYDELQEDIGLRIHGEEWPTIRIPKTAAKAGAWVKDKLAGEEDAQFIKPWMIDLADQNYPVSIGRARQRLGWEPQHTLRSTLPEMIRRLLDDPKRWYEINGLPIPDQIDELQAAAASKS